MNFRIRSLLVVAFGAAVVLLLFETGSELVILRSRAFVIGVIAPLALLLLWAMRRPADEDSK